VHYLVTDGSAQQADLMARGAIGRERKNGELTKGDAAILRFLAVFIEQGGTSLYPSLAQRVKQFGSFTNPPEYGPTETMHFQTWQDKASNAPPLTDSTNGLVFPDLNSPPFGGENFQTNLIMPESCPFLSRKFPVCSIIRSTTSEGTATAARKGPYRERPFHRTIERVF
jgi:hypothetical protein